MALACVVGVAALALPMGQAAARSKAAKAQAAQPWMDTSLPAGQRAQLLLGAMTLEEKLELMSNDLGQPWAYFEAGIPRLGIPSLRMLDAGSGLRLAGVNAGDGEPGGGSSGGASRGKATAMPSTMLLAASFDRALAARYGRTVAEEVREVGGNVLLGPNGDIIRVPWWGRANETESEDPFLTSEIVARYVRAVQEEGVIANLKHYNLYTQEMNRCCGQDARVDERTIQEIYTPPWEAAIRRGGLGSTMCAFNKFNADWACENRHLLIDILKRQLGFDGFVLSDFGAAHDTVASVNNGLDMETGLRRTYTPETLLAAINAGQVTVDTINEHVLRILRPMFRFGLFDESYEATGIAVQEHGETARAVAQQGITLLKNSNATLPLRSRGTRSIAVIGGDANIAVSQGGASHVTPTYSVPILQGLRDRAPAGVDVEWARGSDPVGATSMLGGGAAVPSSVLAPSAGSGETGLRTEYFANTDLAGAPFLTRNELNVAFELGFIGGSPAYASLYGSQREATPGNALSARYTGTITAPGDGEYSFTLTGWGDAQMFLDGRLVVDMTGQNGPRSVTSAPLTLAAGEAHEIRVEYRATRPYNARLEQGTLKLGWTHPANAYSPDQREAAELARDSDVAVVFANTFESEQRDRASLALPEDQDQLIRAVSAANPNTIVVLAAGGPVTMPWLSRVPAVVDSYYAGQEQGNAIADVLFGDVNPSGKLPVTFPRNESQPKQLGIANPWQTLSSLEVPFNEGVFVGYRGYDQKRLDPLFPFGHGLSYTRFRYRNLARIARRTDGGLRVRFTVRNRGRRTGAETAQVYVGRLPTTVPTPPKQLAGFRKVTLDPGEHQRVTVTVSRRALSYFDATQKRWVTPSGRVPIYVGSSSRDIRLSGTATVR
jgi:beta-glucosidase